MRYVMTIVVLLVICTLAFTGMRRGWKGREHRTAALVPTLTTVPADDDPALGAASTEPFGATYVSTTVAGDWLERVVALELGARSAAHVQVFAGGVRIERQGARDLFIPAGAVRGAGTAPGMAGKFVGRDGLVVLTWQATGDLAAEAPTLLDTGLRLRRRTDRAPLIAAVEALVPGPGATPQTHPLAQTSAADRDATRKEHR